MPSTRSPAIEAISVADGRRARGSGLLGSLVLVLSAYAFGMAHDLASARNVPRVKPALMAAMAGLHVVALVRLARGGPRLPVPVPVRVVSGALFVGGLGGMFYSIFVEIPLRKAWLDRGHTDDLVTTGFYALVRHPGVLWLSLAAPFGGLATRSLHLLLAAPVIALGDVVHVWFQERVVLPRVFGQPYCDYQATTPFVVPNRASLERFRRTIRGAAADGVPSRD